MNNPKPERSTKGGDNGQAGDPSAIRSLKDLARLAGVSPGTASRALAGSKLISLPVRQRVQALADQAGYIPDRRAASLRTGRSRDLGIMLFERDSAEESQYTLELVRVINGLASAAQSRGYRIVIVNPSSSKAADACLVDLEHESDALVVFGLDRPAGVNANLPILYWGCGDQAVVRGRLELYLPSACEYMASKGCRRLIILHEGEFYNVSRRKYLDNSASGVDLYKIDSPLSGAGGNLLNLEIGDGILATAIDDVALAVSTIRSAGFTENAELPVALLNLTGATDQQPASCRWVVMPDVEQESIIAIGTLTRAIGAGKREILPFQPCVTAIDPVKHR